jgi:hypothetical protein
VFTTGCTGEIMSHLTTLVVNSTGSYSDLITAELTQYKRNHLCKIPCDECGKCVPIIDMIHWNKLDRFEFPEFESFPVPKVLDLMSQISEY